jgi:hypothetical protein
MSLLQRSPTPMRSNGSSPHAGAELTERRSRIRSYCRRSENLTIRFVPRLPPFSLCVGVGYSGGTPPHDSGRVHFYVCPPPCRLISLRPCRWLPWAMLCGRCPRALSNCGERSLRLLSVLASREGLAADSRTLCFELPEVDANPRIAIGRVGHGGARWAGLTRQALDRGSQRSLLKQRLWRIVCGAFRGIAVITSDSIPRLRHQGIPCLLWWLSL